MENIQPKKIEEALRKSEEKYRVLYETIKDGIVATDINGRILECNQAYADMLGYSKEELKNMTYQQLTPPQWHQMEAQIVKERITKRGYSGEYEKEYVRKSGTVFPIAIKVWLIIGEDGKPVGMWGIIRDITERKRTEEALRRSEEQARRLSEFQSKVIDTAVVWIDLLDNEGNVTLWNRAAELISGYSRDEVIGHKKIWEWLYPDPKYRAKILAETKANFERGERVEDYLTTIRCKDGILKTISWYSNNILDEKGKPVSRVAVGIDITERKEMEEKLRQSSEHLEELVQKKTDELLESEKRYSVLVEEAGDGVAILQDEKLVFTNKRGAEILGYSRDELIGVPFEKLVDEKHRQRARERYMQLLRGETVPAPYESEAITKNGERVQVEVSPTLIHYRGRPADLLILRDISERKRMEEERLRLEKLASIGELATMVAHDLRNPLTSIRNASYYIKNACPARAKAECKTAIEMLNIIEQETLFADTIINDLLDFAVKKPLQKERQNINKLIEGSLTESNIPKNIKVERNFAKKATAIVDEKQLERVFLNLIKNALQVMPNGGKLTVTTTETKDHVEIAFSDTGIGIPEQNMNKIFQPLFSTKAKGIGMGLAICKRIVEQHGGTIDVGSKVGEGTTFVVKLPKKEASKQ